MKPKLEVKYRLVLSHCPNGDIMYDARRGYWTPPMDPTRTEEAAATFYDAKQKFLAWINRNGLGGSNLDVNAGNLMDGKILVARFSYNGKLWHPDGHELPVEEGEAQATQDEDEGEVTGNLLVPKALWGKLCCLAEGVAWSADPLVEKVDEARSICAEIDAHYGAPTPGKYPRLEGAPA